MLALVRVPLRFFSDTCLIYFLMLIGAYLCSDCVSGICRSECFLGGSVCSRCLAPLAPARAQVITNRHFIGDKMDKRFLMKRDTKGVYSCCTSIKWCFVY